METKISKKKKKRRKKTEPPNCPTTQHPTTEPPNPSTQHPTAEPPNHRTTQHPTQYPTQHPSRHPTTHPPNTRPNHPTPDNIHPTHHLRFLLDRVFFSWNSQKRKKTKIADPKFGHLTFLIVEIIVKSKHDFVSVISKVFNKIAKVSKVFVKVKYPNFGSAFVVCSFVFFFFKFFVVQKKPKKPKNEST